MMRRLPTLFFALLQICLLVACRHQISPEAREEMYAYEIITQTLHELASDGIQPPPSLLPGGDLAENEEVANRIRDSLEHAFLLYKDTATFLINISDSFTEPQWYLFEEFQANTYCGLESKLLSGTKKARLLDEKRIGDIRPWKIVEPRPYKGWQCKAREYLGTFFYSRMAFNETFDLALFTYEFCSYQGIILVKRQKGKWRIIKNDQSNAH